jgi:streptogramin lyase
MKLWLAGLLLLIGPPALAQQAVPQIAFDSVPNPLKLPANMYFGEASGVSVNSKGHVFVLSRGNTSGSAYAAAATQLLEFDAKGAFVREIGKNLYAWSFGHTVKIDPADNIWVTDKGSDMVIKFDPEGRVVMVFAASRKRPTKTPRR